MHSVSGGFKETRPVYRFFEKDKAEVETFDLEWLKSLAISKICYTYHITESSGMKIEWEPLLWDLLGRPKLWSAKGFEDYKIAYTKDM